jgi:hypothetical protein
MSKRKKPLNQRIAENAQKRTQSRGLESGLGVFCGNAKSFRLVNCG